LGWVVEPWRCRSTQRSDSSVSARFEVQEILDVAALVPVEGGTEFEQDEPRSADETDLEVQSVFPGFEVLPEMGGKQGEIEAMERGGSVEPIRAEAQFFGDLRCGVLHHPRQRVGADDIAFPLA
jgi:hypothetical protein